MKNFFRNIVLLVRSFFWGLKIADKKIFQQIDTSSKNNIGIEETKEEQSSVWSDLLQHKETRQVQEFRDISYRVLRESMKYKINPDSLKKFVNDKGELEYAFEEGKDMTVKKTFDENLLKHIFKNEKDEIVLVHKCEEVAAESWNDNEYLSFFGSGTGDKNIYETTLETKSDEYRRFIIEKTCKRFVVRENDGKLYGDFYCISIPRDDRVIRGSNGRITIDKSDSFFIKEAEELINGTIRYSDITNFNDIEFTTFKTYNMDDYHKMRYKVVSFDRAFEHRDEGDTTYTGKGDFVFSFNIEFVEDIDIFKKYEMDRVDEMYKNKEAKENNFTMNEFSMELMNKEK